VTAAEIVDHIIPLAQGGEKYDESNLQALCASHHATKHARDYGRK
jgi:5-methylcytosine-specific restriction protein A